MVTESTATETSDASKHNIALVPEDRKLMGLNLVMNVSVNTTMCIDRNLSNSGFLRQKGFEAGCIDG